MLRRIVQKILASRAQQALRRSHPTVIAITGSVGKTTAKDLVAAVLATKFSGGIL